MIHLFFNTSIRKKDPIITYLTGYSPDFGILAYDPIKCQKCMFVIPFELGDYQGIRCIAFNMRQFESDLKRMFGGKFRKIGVNSAFVSWKEMKFIRKSIHPKIVDVSKDYDVVRTIKSKKELRSVLAACRLTDKIYSELISCARKKRFKTEADISIFIKKRALELDAELSFEPVVATSSNASRPHHKAGKTNLNGFTIIDFGLKYKSYCSDMTRTLFFGTPSKKQIETYDFLLNLQMNLIMQLKPGYAIKNLAKLASEKLGKRLVHSVGHGVGIDIHEAPFISSKSKDNVKEGMVIAIEPGIYEGGRYGIRIEDTVAIIAGKPAILTKSDKNLSVIN